MDLMVTATADLDTPLDLHLTLEREAEEVDDELHETCLPDFYKRTFRHPYLQERSFTFDDYEYFPVGVTGKLNPRFADYVIFPVEDNHTTVGYVARHTWSKAEIDTHNRKAKYNGEYKILRYRNSTDNDFSKLLYNYDSIRPDETDTVILTEGIFDVIALTRKLELYDNTHIAAIATFGKKISDVQLYKLQCKGVKVVVVGYDGDAVEAVKHTVDRLKPYFEVLVADIADAKKDWDEMEVDQVYETFAYRLLTPIEYKLSKVQEK
ncbi:toprim domain-containing protein [uncultured Bacteroides sp.]|nr:toprim domain-containing protein [uncultured Bacteroides sp.]